MAHPWSKISLVSAVALAGLCTLFVGCEQDQLNQFHMGLINATAKNQTCVCSFTEFGMKRSVDYPPENGMGYDCYKLQLYLQTTEKRKDAVCTPVQ